jgi:hypothetical protein
MSVYLLCEKTLGLIKAHNLWDITAAQKTMLENYQYQGLVDDHASKEVIACCLYFESVRDGLLHTYPWVFARKTVKLQTPETVAPIAGWKYRYMLPDDCMRLLTIIQQHKTIEEYEQIENTIECDVSPAVIRYTGEMANTEEWTMLFQDAFCARLALEIEPSVGLTGANFRNYLLQLFQYSIAEGYRTGIISPGFAADNYKDQITQNTRSLYPPVAQEGQAYGFQPQAQQQ